MPHLENQLATLARVGGNALSRQEHDRVREVASFGGSEFSSAVCTMCYVGANGRGGHRLFAIGMALVVTIGFVPKVVTEVADATGGVTWGTAAFHFPEAPGFCSLSLWAQALPRLPSA
jgi:hypothetical protein